MSTASGAATRTAAEIERSAGLVSTRLVDTTASAVGRALIAARRAGGGSATGQVLTLIVLSEDDEHDEAVTAAAGTAEEHPSRALVVHRRPASATARLDAEVFGSGDRGPGELVVLHLHGELADHGESVVVPLLAPDTPVVTYWPGAGPADPGAEPLGRLSHRRITDLATAPDPRARLARRALHYSGGDTDLSWTRLTPWRSVLATALDTGIGGATAGSSPAGPVRVTGGLVAGEPGSPSSELLALWLERSLDITVTRAISGGPGLTEVRLSTPRGDIAVRRADGRLAMVSSPGWPERPIALPRRGLDELLAEELRRLDPDDIYADCLATARDRANPPA